MNRTTAETPETKKCPFCAEQVQAAAIKCRFCGSMLDESPIAPTSTSSAHIPAANVDSQPISISGGRILAKTCHLLALGWTVFCIVGVLVGMANVSKSVGSDISGAAAVGVSIGLGFWAFAWFVPVVGLEVVALAATALSKKAPADDVMRKREWRRGFWISAAPNALLVFAILATLGGGSTSPSSSMSTVGGESSQRNGITLAKFNQVHERMGYSEVVGILGETGKEMSSSSLGGTRMVMYSWDAPGFASMTAMFEDDRLVTKSQFGLK